MGLLVANATGTYKQATAIYVANASGTFKLASSVFVADALGTYKNSGAGAPTVSAPTISAGSPGWTKANVAWTASNAVSYEVQTEAGAVLATTGATSVILSVDPNTIYRLKIKAIASNGLTTTSAVTQYTTSQIPAPANLRTVNTPTYNDFELIWNAVQAATAYDLLYVNTGNIIYSGALPGAGGFDIDAVANSSYTYQVRAKIGSATSGYSTAKTVITPPEPGPAAGEYTYKATAGQTYQTGSGGIWRATSDGFYHGDGSSFGSSRGKQTGFFFYGSNRFDELEDGTVTKLEIYMDRKDEAGNNAAQSCHFYLHPYTSKPSGDPLNDFINSGDYDDLARGEAKWITLPTSWGQKLVDNTSGADGIAWGNVSGRYMNMSPLSSDDDIGKLRITIG